MKVVVAQIASHLGDVEKNFDRHLEIIERARNEKADLLVFPELSLTGYTLKDLVGEVAIIPESSPSFERLRELSRDISLVVGFVEEKDRGLFYNSAAYLSEGRIRHIHRKVFMPTYGMFEESKFFAGGKNFSAFDTPFARTGMMICYDFLHYGAGYLLFSDGAEIVIVLSAAPGRGMSEDPGFESARMWEVMGEAISYFSSCYVIYCNRVGYEDGKSFAGGSFIFDPSGKLLGRAAAAEESLLTRELDLDRIRDMHMRKPYRRDNRPEIILESLKRIVSRHED